MMSIKQAPFSMKEAWEDSSAPAPLFFVLFPGVDPGADIEKLGQELGFTEENGRYKSISMGQVTYLLTYLLTRRMAVTSPSRF